MTTGTLVRVEQRPALTFLRHLGGMTVAMFVGMFVFALLLGPVSSAVGSSFNSIRLSHPEWFMLGMCSAMSFTMVAWMRRRGHEWQQCWEMTGAMLVPVVGVLGFYWAGAISSDPICPVSCISMVVAMAVAMLFRLDHYTHRASTTPKSRRVR